MMGFYIVLLVKNIEFFPLDLKEFIPVDRN
jgi:hypothetical protein